MKFLQDYKEKKQSELFERTKTFFAFNSEQIQEGIKKRNIEKGSKILHVGAGCFVPEVHEEELIKGLEEIEAEEIEAEAIKEDIKENGLIEIIKRELINYECHYTGRLTDCYEALEDYPGITKEMIKKTYNETTYEDSQW